MENVHTFIQTYRISKGQCSELRQENAREFTESLQKSDRINEAYNHGIHSNLWCVKENVIRTSTITSRIY